MRETLRRDSGEIVLSWLTKVMLVVVVCGVVLFDAIAVLAGRVATRDDADTVARAASEAYRQTHSVQGAYDAAVTAAAESDATVPVEGFTVAADSTVQLTLRREITTLFLWRVPKLKKYVIATEPGRGTSLPS